MNRNYTKSNTLQARFLAYVFATVLMLMSMFGAFSIKADAATSNIVLGSSEVAVGGTVDVIVNSSAGGTFTVKFTAAALEYVKCDVSGASCTDNVITFTGRSGKITFKGKAEGKANIIVSSSAADGTSAQITVTAGSGAVTSTPAATTTTTTTQPEQTAQTTASESDKDKANENQSMVAETGADVSDAYKSGTVDANGLIMVGDQEYVINQNFTEGQIFRNFYEYTVEIAGKSYRAINNNSRTMLYLTPKNGGDSKFYFYDENSGALNLPMYLGNSDYYVFISTRGFAKDELPSSRFLSTKKMAEFGEYLVYTFSGSEFLYVYGYDAMGNEGWYTYDTRTGRIGRADLIPMSLLERQIDAMTSTYDPADVFRIKLEHFRKLCVGLIIAIILLVVLIINLILRNGGLAAFTRKDDDDDDVIFGDDEDEYDDDDYEDEEDESDEDEFDEDDSDEDDSDDEDDDEDVDDESEADSKDEDLLIPDISSFVSKKTSQTETDLEEAIIREALKDTTSAAKNSAAKVDPVATGAPGSKTSVIDLNNL